MVKVMVVLDICSDCNGNGVFNIGSDCNFGGGF